MDSGPQGAEFDTTALDLAFFLIPPQSVSSLSVIFPEVITNLVVCGLWIPHACNAHIYITCTVYLA